MSLKTAVMWGMIVGSTIGSFVPSLWGAGILSYWAVLTSAIGGIIGIWLAYKLFNNF